MYPPRAAEIPTWRDDLMRHVEKTMPAVYEHFIREGTQVPTPVDPVAGAHGLAEREVQRLRMAELFFVTADMTDLVLAAARTLPDFTLMPPDLPATHGLVVFEKPMGDTPDGAQIVAAAWGPWYGAGIDLKTGLIRPSVGSADALWLDFYSSADLLAGKTNPDGSYTAPPAHLVGTPLLHDHEMQQPFTSTPIDLWELNGETKASWPGQFPPPNDVLRTTWTLMGQTIASVSEHVPSRAESRRLQRGDPSVSHKVRIVELRRRSYPDGSDGESEREYHHRWVVRGHWRNQWHPTVGAHRPIWIAPHIKGPDGAPILGGEKVHALKR